MTRFCCKAQVKTRVRITACRKSDYANSDIEPRRAGLYRRVSEQVEIAIP
jgi:hypothetical protein